MIGERVRHARAYYGWSGKELAQRVDVPQPKISQLENGDYVSAELVDAIARATGFRRWWFDLGPLPDLPKGSLKFRKQASGSARDDERIRAHVRNAIEIVQKFGDRPEVPKVAFQPIGPADIVELDDIELVATTAREWLGVGPSDAIPNLIRSVERAGVIVIGSALEIERHYGASYWHDYPYGRPMICVTRGMPGDRQRFSVGHELGHLVLHQFRTQLPPERAEKEAHRFAGALLIPEHMARAEFDGPVTLRDLASAKSRWGISIRALVARCFDLRIIDAARRLSLEKQISARGWTKTEPVEVANESPRLLRRIVEISTDKNLADATGLPPMATRDLLA